MSSTKSEAELKREKIQWLRAIVARRSSTLKALLEVCELSSTVEHVSDEELEALCQFLAGMFAAKRHLSLESIEADAMAIGYAFGQDQNRKVAAKLAAQEQSNVTKH